MNEKTCYRTRQTQFDVRSENDEMLIEGDFIVFDERYEICPGLYETIAPGAIDDDTDTSDVRALVDHLTHLVLGRTTADTLTMSIDDKRVHCRIKINSQDSDAVNLYARTQRGDVNQASFGFDDDRVEWIDHPDGSTERRITHISKLWEVSVCTFPAYEATSVEARSVVKTEFEHLRQQALNEKKAKLKRRFKHA